VLNPVRGRQALVFFTDGVDTCSRRAGRNETVEMAKETRATIYCVYYDTENDLYRGRQRSTIPGLPPITIDPFPPSRIPPMGGPGGSTSRDYQFGRNYLDELSEFSGGLVFDGRQDLRNTFAEVARELASQYSIGYYSSNDKRDGKFRKVDVKVNQKGLVARTKKGYYPQNNSRR